MSQSAAALVLGERVGSGIVFSGFVLAVLAAGQSAAPQAAVQPPSGASIAFPFLNAIAAALIAGVVSAVVAERRISREFRLHFQAETVLRKLLKSSKWRLRTFKTIKHHVGGFEDDELRKLLVQAGAIRFTDARGDEIWGLVERNEDLLESEYGTEGN